LNDIVREHPPNKQNDLFGDDIFLQVVDAPTSFAVQRIREFIADPITLEVPNPQTGIVRIAVMGAWTNAGPISTDLIIEQERHPQGPSTATGRISQGETDVVQLEIAPGTAQAVFELSWKEHWGHYPTDDLDLILIDPAGVRDFTGTALASPERVLVSDPLAGTWKLVVAGLSVHDDAHDDRHRDAESKWELRVTADGTRLRSHHDYDDFDSESDDDSDSDSEEDSDRDSVEDSDSD
jgi:hypothetical protein